MDLDDTARVLHPRDAIEYRLGVVADITYAPSTTYIQRYHLRFPNGQERSYPAEQVTACTRADDRTAIETALTAASRSLRDACRRAHDHDDDLSASIASLLTTLVGAAQTHVGITLKPAHLDPPADTEDVALMTPGWTHGRSTRHPGAVCGADDGPDTRITDEPHLVTCPDCPDAAEIETIPDDATTGDPRVIQLLREAKQGHSRKISGVIVDATTANAILTVYDAATPKTQKKIATLPITIMTSFAWRVLNPDS